MNKKERNELVRLLDFRSTLSQSYFPFRLDGERHTLDSGEMAAVAMYARYGAPCVCLHCRVPIAVRENVIKEIDAWFCSQHCPVCEQQDWLNGGQYGSYRK